MSPLILCLHVSHWRGFHLQALFGGLQTVLMLRSVDRLLPGVREAIQPSVLRRSDHAGFPLLRATGSSRSRRSHLRFGAPGTLVPVVLRGTPQGTPWGVPHPLFACTAKAWVIARCAFAFYFCQKEITTAPANERTSSERKSILIQLTSVSNLYCIQEGSRSFSRWFKG